ncbi:elongation factor 4 [Candidatus Curtissbacteria bacterium]|nr:elongation factor 4 [Candidatus Curtissbacteria bacterium]
MEIRNFALIAHVDHGKSTLADRIMEICGAVDQNHPEQLLDSLELEREHGITIKLKAIRLVYRSSFIVNRIEKESPDEPLTINDSPQIQNFVLNLIDTPGHVDFSYEVSRSLASVEGAVLVVDATQGIQAQTLANFNLALEANLTIIPVINKIDLPQAQIEKTAQELVSLGFSEKEIIKVSARTGEGVEAVIRAIIDRIPAPGNTPGVSSGSPGVSKPQALIFDSSLDPYKGVVATVRVFGGRINVGDRILFLANPNAKATILQIGYLTPKPHFVENVTSGEIAFVVTNLKDLSKVKVGDTITDPKSPAQPLPGYQAAKPVVFLSFYPSDPKDLVKLKDALEKLKLNDSSLSFTTESSISLGQGFRIGFLGLLHAQITQERLEREYDLDIITTSPSVNFIVNDKLINKAGDFDPTEKNVKEPIASVTIFVPQAYSGVVSKLITDKRGEQENFETIGNLLKIEAKIPLLELLIGFYDQLKSQTSGYASLDFEIADYRPADLVKLDILVNHEPIEGLSQIVPRVRAEEIARKLCEKLKDAIPRQQIPIPIQAAIGSASVASAKGAGKIIARETIASYRKDVTAKLYGGDVTRKMKLLEKQKKGKKRMRRFGQVDIPQEAFLAVLKI